MVFKDGPPEAFNLEWATHFDAADQSGLSRIYGGIQAYYDDFPVKKISSEIGKRSAETATKMFN